MNQTKIESLIESNVNILSGWLIALFIWTFLVGPLWGFETNMLDNLSITGLFTIVSIIRSYFWRRFFNAGLHRVVHSLVGGIFNGRG